MINTNFKQGMFKKYDNLVIVDRLYPNDWTIVFIRENYGVARDINAITFYRNGEKTVKMMKMDTQVVDMFYDVYKIVKEYTKWLMNNIYHNF